MSAFTTLLNALFLVDKPITSSIGLALRDNPLAMFEGAVGAPRLQFAALDAAFSTAGGVGTYVFAAAPSLTTVGFGATVAGSTLQPTSAAYSATISSTAVTGAFALGSALSGTWRCMGSFSRNSSGAGGAPALLGATLWLRIS